MEIKIPATLTAHIEEILHDSRPWVEDSTYEVVVEFGHVEIARLTPVREIWYGVDEDDRDTIAAETVAPYLARIFATEAQ